MFTFSLNFSLHIPASNFQTFNWKDYLILMDSNYQSTIGRWSSTFMYSLPLPLSVTGAIGLRMLECFNVIHTYWFTGEMQNEHVCMLFIWTTKMNARICRANERLFHLEPTYTCFYFKTNCGERVVYLSGWFRWTEICKHMLQLRNRRQLSKEPAV